MKKISLRHKISGIESSQSGIGISTSARKYYRQARPEYANAPKDDINNAIAQEFASATPEHRFKLRSGEIAEIRRSNNFLLVAAIRGRGTASARYDIIVIQQSYKQPPEELRKRRLQPGWGEG